MKLFRSLCYGKKETYKELLQNFKEDTDNAKDMSKYSSLVTKAIRDITGKVEEENMMNIFDFDGFNEEFKDKAAIQSLMTNKEFHCNYNISFFE